MFDIDFCSAEENVELSKLSLGGITIGTFSEAFEIDFSFWGRDDYRRQWFDDERDRQRSEQQHAVLSGQHPVMVWPGGWGGTAPANPQTICISPGLPALAT